MSERDDLLKCLEDAALVYGARARDLPLAKKRLTDSLQQTRTNALARHLEAVNGYDSAVERASQALHILKNAAVALETYDATIHPPETLKGT